MAISGSRYPRRIGIARFRPRPLAGVLAVAACLADGRAMADDLWCGADRGLRVEELRLLGCGPCPDTPPPAMPPRAFKRVEEECKKHPPARLARRGQLARGPMPACSPCKSTLLRTAAPIYRAALRREPLPSRH